MKVLYIGRERGDAQAVATALRSIDEVVSVLWASQLDHAAKWLDETRDLAALVIEAPTDGGSCAAVLTHVRCMTQPPAVVLIVPDGIGPSLDSLPAWADFIRRDQSLQRDLPIVVTRAIGRAARVDIEQKLEHATTALQQSEQRYRTAADQLAGLAAQYEIGVARAAASWDMVDEQLRTAALEVERARQNQDAAAAEVSRLSLRHAELSAQLAEAAATRDALERRLADAEAGIEAANTRTEHERLAAAEQLADRQREFQTEIAWEIDQRLDVEQRLASATIDAATRSRELEEALCQVRQEMQSRTADIERLTTREAELNSTLEEINASRQDLERRLAATRAAFEETATRGTRERLAASKKAAEREAELEGRLNQERTTRAALEQTVADTETALRDAQQRHEAAIADASHDLAELQAARQAIEHQLADATTAIREAAARETALDAQLQQERTTRATLEQTVADGETALRDAQQRHEAAMADAAHDLADLQATRQAIEHQLADATTAIREAAARETALDAQLQQERTTRATLEQTVADGETALRDAQQRHEAAMADAAHDLAELQAARQAIEHQLADATTAIREAAGRETALDAQLQQERTTRATLEQTVADGKTALRDAQQRHNAAMADASHDLAELQAARQAIEHQLADATTAIREAAARETALDAQLQQERTTRATLQQTVADGETAFRDAQQRHEAAIADAAHELAELQAARQAIEHQLADATTAIREAAARETALDAQLQQERTTRATLEQTVADTETALRDAQQRHEAAAAEAAHELADLQATREAVEHQLADATTAIGEAAARETALDAQLQQERTARATLEQTVADTETALRDAQQRHDTALAAAAAELAERQTHFDRELLQRADDRDQLTQRLRVTKADLDDVCRAYESATADLERLTQREADLASQLANQQADFERERSESAADRGHLAQRLNESDAALDQMRRQHRAAAADVELLMDRATDLVAQLADVQGANEVLERQLADATRAAATERDTLQTSLATLREESQRLQQVLTANIEQLEASRAESHRLFDQAGVAMFRCSRDGALTEVNRVCTTLIGRRTIGELTGIEFAATVFEDPNVLSWLIERCLTTRTRESIETAWRRQDGSRLFMRLSARPCATDIVEVVAEDLTRVRVLEESRGRAQRMEAVGRLALEVAVTCSTLLSGIQQKGRDWLEATGDNRSRDEGERLFDEVGRAAGFLRELAACGNEQARTPTLVDLNTLVRDLEPVLKRVAGDDVEVQLRDTSSPLNVEIGTERAERLLVNLASYGRGRMPSGGRLRIELGTSVVDRRFTAKHPNVRLGLHALITVTEVGRPAGSGEGRARAARRPGVDFGTLQELVSECGGHLWMSVQPAGDMVAKIRLPLSIPDDPPLPRAASRAARGRTAARWFQT